MENARIIKLDSPLTVYANNFDEVFGEYSNMSSKRKARIVQRQANKQEVVAARAATKVAKQQAKSTVKSARIAKRQDAQQGRVAKRTAATQARQQKRIVRKTARVERKAIGQEPEALATENGSAQPEDVSQDETEGAADETTMSDDQPIAYGQEDSAPEDETESTEESDIEAGEEEAADDSEDSGADGYNDVFASADGMDYENLGDINDIYALNDDDFYTYESGSANPDGKIGMVRGKISPEVKDIAMKSEWNKEMVLQKQKQVAAINNTLGSGAVNADQAMQLGKKRSQAMSDIELHKDRAVSFDGVLSDYCNMDGDDSSAEGDYSEALGRKKRTEKKRRKSEVKAAKREARKSRKKSIFSRVKKNKATKVPAGLNPEFDTQRITIPASELSTGANGETGLIALDDINDFDAPMENEYSLASGSPLKNVNWKGVLIGVAVAGLAIWGAKKTKLF
jgi:hypothetical protein